MVKYPAQIDDSTSIPTAVDNNTPVTASVTNRLRSAIIAIETELGVKPGGVSTVRGRLDTLSGIIDNLDFIVLDGDLGGTTSVPLVIGLQGNPISDASPATDSVLTWNGLAWEPAASVAGVPGGSNTQVQFNDSNVFAGDAGFTYNKTTNLLSLTDALAIGTIPSSTGTIRLANGSTVKARNFADSADLIVFDATVDNELFIGTNAAFSSTQFGTLRLASGTPMILGIGTAQNLTITSSILSSLNPITIGTNPASSGTLRLPGTSQVNMRNFDNSADVTALSIATSTGDNYLFVGFNGNGGGFATPFETTIFGANTSQAFSIGGTQKLEITSSLISSAIPIAFGTIPASAGIIRLSTGTTNSILFRNAGDTDNILLGLVDASDYLWIGDNVGNTLSSSRTYLRANNQIHLGVQGSDKFILANNEITLLTRRTVESTINYGSFITELQELATTDDTITDIYTWTIIDEATTVADVMITAISEDGATSDAWKGYIMFNRTGGTVTASSPVTTQIGASAWVFTLDNSTATGRVRVTGAVATNIFWSATIRLQAAVVPVP